MATMHPLAQAEKLAGSKEELIAKVKTLATEGFWINRFRSENGWDRLSNAKLLRLHRLLTTAHDRFASRAEIIETLAKLEGHGKDADYKKARESWSLPRLLDALQSSEHRAKRAARKTAPKTARATA